MDQRDVNPADYGYFSDEPSRMKLDESAPAAIATLVHAHLVETGRDSANSRLLVAVSGDDVSIQIQSPDHAGEMRPIRLPKHEEIEDRLTIAQRDEDVLCLHYGTLEVDFGTDFQSQRRAGSEIIDFHLGDIGLDRSHFGLEAITDRPTRLETVAEALAELHAPRLPAGTNRRYSLIVDDEEAVVRVTTTSFSGEPIRTRIALDREMQDRIIAMRDDPGGRHYSPIASDLQKNTYVDVRDAPFAHDVAPGGDERLEAALSALRPLAGGIMGQAKGLDALGIKNRMSGRGPDGDPKHDPLLQRRRGQGR